jgi:hypothetical protein
VCVTDFLTVGSYDTKVVYCILRQFQLFERSKFLLRTATNEFCVSPPSFYWLHQHLAPCNFRIFPSLKMGRIQRSSFCVRGGNSTQRDSRSHCQSRTRIGLSEVRPATAAIQQRRRIKCVRLPEFRELSDPPTVCGFRLMGCL